MYVCILCIDKFNQSESRQLQSEIQTADETNNTCTGNILKRP